MVNIRLNRMSTRNQHCGYSFISTMATAANSETEVGISSDDVDRPLICQPCGEDGETLSAVGFCVNCSEYLCRKCYDGHLIPSITRKHVLQRLGEEQTSAKTRESKYSCQQHGNEQVKYHCPTHSFFGCHVCFFRHQKSCKDVIYIPDVTMPTSGSGECDKFFQKLTNISSKCAQLVSEVKSSLQAITSKHTEAITTVREFKQKLIDIIDKMEKELVENIEKQQSNETKRMGELSIKCEKILKDAQKMSASMEVLQNKDRDCDLYIETVQSKDTILNLEDQLKLIEKKKLVNMPVFQPNKDLADLLMSPWSLGNISLKSLHIEMLEHLQDITCKSRNDTDNCIITESVLLPGQKLIVTDWQTGHTVKLIDLQQNKIQSDLRLSSDTWGMCKITDTSVAVTLPNDEKIAFLRTNPTLAVEREMKLNDQPWDIVHLDSKLVVSYNDPCKIEIMDMEGRLIRTISTNDNGQALLNKPSHIAIHPINKQIYVSNETSKVVCMTLDGTVVATYKDNELIIPRQVTFDSSGMVYVCGEGSHNVHQITANCQKVKVILNSRNGLNYPLSISYDEIECLFYIGGISNSIIVYKVANSAI